MGHKVYEGFVQKYEAGIKKKKFMFVFVIDYNGL